MTTHINKVHTATPHSVTEEPIFKQSRITIRLLYNHRTKKKQFDFGIGRFFSSNNIPFRAIESFHFQKLINDRQHAYQPPRKLLGKYLQSSKKWEDRSYREKRFY